MNVEHLSAWAHAAGDPTISIEALNAGCFCVSLDQAALARALQEEFGSPAIVDLVRAFSDAQVDPADVG